MRTDPGLLNQMITLYREGVPLRTIGEIVHRDFSWVSKRIKKTGEPGRRVTYKQDIIKLRQEGVGQKEISERLGASIYTVRKVCSMTGLTTR